MLNSDAEYWCVLNTSKVMSSVWLSYSLSSSSLSNSTALFIFYSKFWVVYFIFYSSSFFLDWNIYWKFSYSFVGFSEFLCLGMLYFLLLRVWDIIGIGIGTWIAAFYFYRRSDDREISLSGKIIAWVYC